jgi:membrane fusion protein (multidrug efflux system)
MAPDTSHAPSTSNATPTTPVAPSVPAPSRRLPRLARWAAWCAAAGIAIVAAYFGLHWWTYRLAHSITDDAFVEAHIVNVAPEMISGRIVGFHVEENDRVELDQVLAEVEPIHYRDQVKQARGKLDLAEAELKRQEAGLAKLEHEVPLQIDVATETLAVARTEEAKAKEALKLTTDEVNRTIEEAQAAVEVAKANAVLARQLYDRWTALARTGAATPEKAEEVTRAYDAAKAERQLADAKLAKAEASRTRIAVARRDLEAAQSLVAKAQKALDLAKTGYDQIQETRLLVGVKQEMVNDARIALDSATHQLQFTQVRAPFPRVVVKRYRQLGDFVSAGVPILSMYHPDLIYVTANLEETRLRGVAPGNSVELQADAFAEPFRGRVVWINKSTGAQFALMPRNVVSGEFTKVVQRVPVRIAIEKDERWPLLRAGLSVQAIIAHGPGDLEWAEQAASEMRNLEARYNQPQPPGRGVGPGDQP